MLLRVFSFLFILLWYVPDLVAQETGNGMFLKFPTPHVVRSAGGRFILEGTNSIQNLELGVWAEEVVSKVERAMAVKLPYGESRAIRIIVTDDASQEGAGHVTAEEIVDGQWLVLRLNIYNYDKIDGVDADAALCRLLLDGLVAWLQLKQNAEDISPVAASLRTNSVPAWIWHGVSRYIYQDLRAKDTDTVLMLWKKAQLKPFPELVEMGQTKKDYPVESIHGVIIAWIESLPAGEDLFQRMFEHLSKGGHLSMDWFTKNIEGCKSAADVDEKWENWILSQWRVVHRLGVATALQVEQLKERLALHHGDIGMPLTSNMGQRTAFRSLIGSKQPDWMPTVLRNKISELKLLGAGKGTDFNVVVDLYGRFLEAVIAGARQDHLASLLEKAEEAFRSLESKVNTTGLEMEAK